MDCESMFVCGYDFSNLQGHSRMLLAGSANMPKAIVLTVVCHDSMLTSPMVTETRDIGVYNPPSLDPDVLPAFFPDLAKC